MFQAELARMMQEERHKDLMRELARERERSKNAPHRTFATARVLLGVPFALAMFVSRVLALYSHTTHRSL